MILSADAPACQGQTYPLARRNQPQWLEIGAFLLSQKFKLSRAPGTAAVRRAAAEGAPLAGEGSAAARGAVRAIPVGNHGDNRRCYE
jgi:hypothetical protein